MTGITSRTCPDRPLPRGAPGRVLLYRVSDPGFLEEGDEDGKASGSRDDRTPCGDEDTGDQGREEEKGNTGEEQPGSSPEKDPPHPPVDREEAPDKEEEEPGKDRDHGTEVDDQVKYEIAPQKDEDTDHDG